MRHPRFERIALLDIIGSPGGVSRVFPDFNHATRAMRTALRAREIGVVLVVDNLSEHAVEFHRDGEILGIGMESFPFVEQRIALESSLAETSGSPAAPSV